MKNIFLFICCVCTSSLFAQQSPWGFFTPNAEAKFKIFEGIAQIEGEALAVGDYVGAFNENDELIGVTQIEEHIAGQALFSLEIFESSAANGIWAGSMYQLQYYAAAERQFYTVETFGPWTAASRNGALADGDNRTIYNTDDTAENSISLPIELASFTGKATEAGNALFWSTATEKDNAHFILEKSADGVAFNPFAQVKAAGNSSEIQHYQHLDESPFGKTTYYRLLHVAFDGTIETSRIVVIQTPTNQLLSEVQLFPNPATEQFTLYLPTNKTINQLRIMDVTGKTMLQQPIENSIHSLAVDVNKWAAGIYIIQLYSDQQQWTELLQIK